MLCLDRARPSARTRSSWRSKKPSSSRCRRWRSGSSTPASSHAGRCAAAATTRVASCRVARAEPAHAGVELDVHARRRPRAAASQASATSLAPRRRCRRPARAPRSSSARSLQRAHDQDGRSRSPASRSSSASPIVGDRQPGRARTPARRERSHRAVAVAVSLDDRAQLQRPPQLGAQARAVARDRIRIDVGAVRAPCAHADAPRSHAAQPRQRAPITSVAITPSGAPSFARRDRGRPAHAAAHPRRPPSNGDRPWASSAAITPQSTSPVPAVASAGTAAGADGDHAGGIGDERVVALEHDHRPGPLCRRAHVRQALARDLGGCRSRAVAPARPGAA